LSNSISQDEGFLFFGLSSKFGLNKSIFFKLICPVKIREM